MKFTVLPNWNNHPSRLPLTGDPGSPQLTATHDTLGFVHCPSDRHVLVNGLPSRKKPSLHKNLTVEPIVLFPTAMAFLGASGAEHVLAGVGSWASAS